MERLSAAIVARNEAENIRRCVSSLEWADEIVVVDTGSVDGTLEICAGAGCRVLRSEWLGFSATKQLAVDSCSSDWVLVVDADEEVSPEMAAEVRAELESPAHAGYRVCRASWYLGRRIRHCGWGRDRPLRLFDRRCGRFDGRPVHESVRIESGSVGTLRGPLRHYPCPDVQTHVRKMVRYAGLGAGEGGSSLLSAAAHGGWKLLSMYVLKLGFLDGREGLILCLNSAFGVYLKHLMRWEARRDR